MINISSSFTSHIHQNLMQTNKYFENWIPNRFLEIAPETVQNWEARDRPSVSPLPDSLLH